MPGAWHPPVRPIGHPVPLADNYSDSVVFVCAEDIDGTKEPCGTAFFVTTQGEDRFWWTYLVTAKHIIQSDRPMWMRLRPVGGGEPVDEPISRWITHPTADVAITPCSIDPAEYIYLRIPEDQFMDRWRARYDSIIVRGDVVSFIGLLRSVETMRRRAIPMVRGGVLGATYQTVIPLRDEVLNCTVEEPCAHLIDCRSVGGFSGSPVFVEQPGIVERSPGDLAIGGANALLGVLIGHFEGSDAGVGVVVPVEAIRELLEDFVDDRKQQDAAARQRKQADRDANAAVRDSAGTGQTEFQRFEVLTRRLVNVPKRDIDEKRGES